MTTVHKQNFIGGEWVNALEGETSNVLNPATGEVLAVVPRGSAADVDRAVRAAARALPQWLETTPQDRARMLLRLADAIDEHVEELARAESQNVGKPLPTARFEVQAAADNVRFFAGAGRCLEGRAAGEYARGYTSMLRREPIGIVAGIAPWNYPLVMSVWKIGPALAAGNVCLLKPSEDAPLTPLMLAELAQEILPAGVLNVITGDGHPVGTGIVRHPDVGLVSLTGDVATGKEVARAAADTLKRVHLELGGKAPMVVFDDADPVAVARAVRAGAYENAGQDCTAASRVVAGPQIYADLLDALVPMVESLRVGDPAESEEIEMGPVISNTQRDRVLGFVSRASAAEATVLTGGMAVGDRGFFIAPTVIVDVDQKAEIVQREVFGPVVTVQRFRDQSEAIGWANDVDYGLAASVWTRDVDLALSAVRQLDFGVVWINDHLPIVAEMPHGGFGKSGYGKEMSMYAVEEYTRTKHVMAKFDPNANPWSDRETGPGDPSL